MHLKVEKMSQQDLIVTMFSIREEILQTFFLILQQDPYIASMEHHTDWVNDIVLCCSGKTCKYLNV